MVNKNKVDKKELEPASTSQQAIALGVIVAGLYIYMRTCKEVEKIW